MITISQGAIIEGKANCFKHNRFAPLELTEKQELALKELTSPAVEELLYGGSAGGGKSWLGCEWFLWNCLAYPGTRWFLARKQLNDIRRSTVVTFNKVFRKHRILPDFYKYNDNSVRFEFSNGSVIEGLDIDYKPGDPDFDRLGSTEYTGGWIEEAGETSAKAHEVLKSRIGRHMNDHYGLRGKIYLTCNPTKNYIYARFYRPFMDGDLNEKFRVVLANIHDNTKRESGYLENLQGLTGELRERLYVGNWNYDHDPARLIEFDAIQDLFENDYIQPDPNRKALVADIALHGSDLFRVGVFYGDVLVEHAKMEKSGGRQVVNLIKSIQAKHGIRGAKVLYDADGLGGFIGREGGFIPGAIPFHGNSPAIKNLGLVKFSEFANLKAQCAFHLAAKINNGQIWAAAVKDETDREVLSEELGQIKKAFSDLDGKLRLVKKAIVIDAIGRSPDFADLFLMHQYFDLRLNGKIIKPRSVH